MVFLKAAFQTERGNVGSDNEITEIAFRQINKKEVLAEISKLLSANNICSE